MRGAEALLRPLSGESVRQPDLAPGIAGVSESSDRSAFEISSQGYQTNRFSVSALNTARAAYPRGRGFQTRERCGNKFKHQTPIENREP